MNAVERLQYYAGGTLPQEAAYDLPDKDPGQQWPREGCVKFDNVVMSYRPGLPPVLKGM